MFKIYNAKCQISAMFIGFVYCNDEKNVVSYWKRQGLSGVPDGPAECFYGSACGYATCKPFFCGPNGPTDRKGWQYGERIEPEDRIGGRQ